MVLDPGFLETGRNFYEQIDMLDRAGVDVLVMDRQWAGLSDGARGGIDRGFGIAATPRPSRLMPRNLPIKNTRIYRANRSCSRATAWARPGVIGALTLNDNGLIDLQGPAMPKGLNAAVEAPYFASTRTVVNTMLSGMARIPILRIIPLRALGVPIISLNHTVQAKIARHTTVEDTRARAQAFAAPAQDIQFIRDLIKAGKGPQGHVWIVAGTGDLLADEKVTPRSRQRHGIARHASDAAYKESCAGRGSSISEAVDRSDPSSHRALSAKNVPSITLSRTFSISLMMNHTLW